MEVVLPEAVSTRIWRYGFFEEDVTYFFLSTLQRGAVCIDIGAHFGYFALLASHLTGRAGTVIAVEPMPATFVQLERNVQLHAAYPNIALVEAAAYDVDTELEFSDFGIVGSAFNSAFAPRAGAPQVAPKQRICVRARRTSAVAREAQVDRLDLVKIDAESAEQHVLRGLEDLLTRFRPAIILEVGDQGVEGAAPSVDLVLWLQERGFTPFEYREQTTAIHKRQTSYSYGNLLFLPNDK